MGNTVCVDRTNNHDYLDNNLFGAKFNNNHTNNIVVKFDYNDFIIKKRRKRKRKRKNLNK